MSDVAAGITEANLHVWNTPGKYRSLSETSCANSGSSSTSGCAEGARASSPAVGIDSPKFSPLWADVGRRKRLGESPPLSAITAADFSPYHIVQECLLTPGEITAGRRSGVQRDMEDDDYMDISSAAKDLRELSQMTADGRVGCGEDQAPSSADMGRSRSGVLKAGRVRGGFE